MPSTFFTSDTHYAHQNIVRGVTRWEDKSGCRDHETVEEMNELLVENINRTVGVDDHLFHDGDWSFGGASKVKEFRAKIRCRNVHLVLGNHDTLIHRDPALQSLFSTVSFYREISMNSQKIVLCHYPLMTWNGWYEGSWQLYGHCHGRAENHIPASLVLKMLSDGGSKDLADLARKEEKINILPNGKSLDVGVDTHPEFRPYSFQEIKVIMDQRR
jgi:calcineurin-like phosphoesterase family protein